MTLPSGENFKNFLKLTLNLTGTAARAIFDNAVGIAVPDHRHAPRRGCRGYAKGTRMIEYDIADMMDGVKNMIEASDIRAGDQVLLLADRRSDTASMEAITAGLKFMGAEPMSLVTEPISRYGAGAPGGAASHARVRRGDLGVAGLHHLHAGPSGHGPQARGERHPAQGTTDEALLHLLRGNPGPAGARLRPVPEPGAVEAGGKGPGGRGRGQGGADRGRTRQPSDRHL